MFLSQQRLPKWSVRYGIALLAFLVPYFVFARLSAPAPLRYFNDFVLVIYASVALYYFVRATYCTRHRQPSLHMAWLLLTLSIISIVGAVCIWVYVEIIISDIGTAVAGLPFVILSHLLLGAGVYSFPQEREGLIAGVGQVTDVLIIMIGFSLPLWAFWLNPMFQQSELNAGMMGMTTIYLLSDLVLIAALGSLLFRRHLLQPKPPIFLLGFSILAMLAADICLALQMNNRFYAAGSWVDYLHLTALILATLSAQAQIDSVETPYVSRNWGKRMARLASGIRSALPPLLLFANFVVMVMTHNSGSHYNFRLMAFGVGIMFVLVSIHQVFTLMENVDLTNALRAELVDRRQAQIELQQINETLEQHVAERTSELMIANDQLRENERKLRFDAFHDKLTGLPNRTAFIHHLEGALHAFRTDPTYRFAVLFLDFDSFKIVNDSLGHWLGDEFLVALARRIKEEIPIGNLAARLGGDEFVVLVENILNDQEVLEIVDHLQRTLRQPYDVRDYRLYTTASIGVVMNDEFHQTAGDLLRDADIAMYQAKENGKARCIVFDAKMRAQAIARLKLETALRYALTHDELQLVYQPIWSVAHKCITGFEALARWRNKEQGLILPAEFIPIAEETGLIIPLGEWVLEEACRQLKQWQEHVDNALPLTVSVNISAHQLYQGDLLAVVERTLQKTGLSASSLKLEITESVFMENIEAAIATCTQLRDMGVGLQIDDFGTGYSSFNYLHRLPINTMKIDKSFIDLIELGGQHVEIVRTIATLAQSLQLSVIAEGVETEAQLHYIEALGCEQVQGYLISKPLDRVTAEAFITSSLAHQELPTIARKRQPAVQHAMDYSSLPIAAM